jgi:hypothetical protein
VARSKSSGWSLTTRYQAGSLLEEKTNDPCVRVQTDRALQRSAMSWLVCVDICIVFKQSLHNLYVALLRCQPQSATVAACFDAASTSFNQQFDHRDVTFK